MKKFFVAAFCLMFAGCASQAITRFDSNPRGAAIICPQSNFGYTPTERYPTPEIWKSTVSADGKSTLFDNCYAQWPSGATAHFATSIDAEKRIMSVYANRPTNAEFPGLEKDLGFAVELMRIQASQYSQPVINIQQQTAQPAPVFQPQPLPTVPSVPFPSAPGRTNTICRTLSNDTIVCD